MRRSRAEPGRGAACARGPRGAGNPRRAAARAILPPALALLLPALLACPSAPRGPAFPALAAEAPEDVRRELRAVCDALRAGENEFYGTAPMEELTRYVAQPVPEPLPRAVVRARLGMEHLREGDAAAAVRLLEEARRIAVEAELDPALVSDVLRRLALAHLRLAEQANCIGRHVAASCIYPPTPAAVHADPAPARTAAALYREYLAREPADPTARWLLRLASAVAGEPSPDGAGVPPAVARGGALGRFVDVAGPAGLRVTKPSGGAVLDDFDGDGRLDVVTSTIDPCGAMTYHHNVGDGTFEERSAAAQLDAQLGGLNLIHADYDNDGDLDLLVLRGGWFGADGAMRNSLLRNRGDGVFDDVTRAAGLAEPAYPTQTGAWGDYDGDGDLDLYVGNEAAESLYAGGRGSGAGYPSQLFRNDGDGTFTDVAATAGVTNERFAKGVAWGDYDGDGDPDLYVSNIGPNRLYRNEGDGTFTDVAAAAGVLEPAGRSFATWFFDYDNDGNLDLFVADYGARVAEVAAHHLGEPVAGGHPRLYRNEGDGTFRDVSRDAGFDAPALAMGANFGDIDGDGYPDVYLGTGAPSFESLAPNRMYRNDAGRRFVDVTYAGGFGHLQKGHGVAFGDVDGDGDQDVFEQMGGAYPGDAYPSVLYENPGHGAAWITLRLVGVRANRSAIGARLALTLATPRGPRTVHAEVGSGGSFGGSSLRQELGLGDAGRVTRLVVRWPGSGTRQVLDDLAVDRAYEIVEGADRPRALQLPAFRLGGARRDGARSARRP